MANAPRRTPKNLPLAHLLENLGHYLRILRGTAVWRLVGMLLTAALMLVLWWLFLRHY